MHALDLPNLRDAPFRLGVGPADAVAHRSWRETFEGALAALAAGPARIAVLGGAGSGKTLMLHALAGALRGEGRVVLVAPPGGLPADVPGDVALLVDDADKLDGGALARLARREGACVLAGSAALATRLPAPVTTLALLPLPPDEVARFVAARLAAAGQRRDLMEPDAVLALSRLSGGVPRQVNALAGAALFLAGLDGAALVGRRHVEEAAAMRDGEADAAPAPLAPAPIAPDTVRVPPAPEPVEAAAPGPAPIAERPAQVPPRPLSQPAAPKRGRAPRPGAVAAVAAGLLILFGAVLASRSRDVGPRAGVQPAAPAMLAQPAATPQPASVAQPQQQAATLPAPAPTPAPTAKPAPREAPAAPSDAALAMSGLRLRAAPPAPREPTPPAAPAREAEPAPPAPEAVSPPATPEPAAAPGPRVVLHYHDDGAAEADRLAALLAGQGARFARIEARAVAGTPRAATIRFFHPEDIGAAWELQAALSATGEDWQVRNFTGFRPRPRRGTLEVWIP